MVAQNFATSAVDVSKNAFAGVYININICVYIYVYRYIYVYMRWLYEERIILW